MKIGIVVDGDAESQALKLLTRRITIPGVQIIDPVFANMQPKATAAQIARAAAGVVGTLKNRDADKIIVNIDLEDRGDCPGAWAGSIEDAFRDLGHQDVRVTIKKRRFENWLIADLLALRKAKARFALSGGFESQVSPNKADHVVDAHRLLDTACLKVPYHKRRDAAAIASAQDPLNVAANSRSFRRFLRLLDHPSYTSQSRSPL